MLLSYPPKNWFKRAGDWINYFILDQRHKNARWIFSVFHKLFLDFTMAHYHYINIQIRSSLERGIDQSHQASIWPLVQQWICTVWSINRISITIEIEGERKSELFDYLNPEDDFQFLYDADGDDETLINFKSNVR